MRRAAFSSPPPCWRRAVTHAQLGPEASLAAPHGFVKRMSVSPEHGPPGTPVRITA